jgi:hypothetical protein
VIKFRVKFHPLQETQAIRGRYPALAAATDKPWIGTGLNRSVASGRGENISELLRLASL